TTGSYNTAVGADALYYNTTGQYNTATGMGSLTYNTTGSFNTAYGSGTLYLNTTGIYNTANGYGSLYYNTTGSRNTANGLGALTYNTTGSFNSADGFLALYYNTTGSFNTAAGAGALYSNTTSSNNTAVGYNSLAFNSNGSNNTAIGYYAGYGATGTNFNQCTFVGTNSFPTISRSNVTMLGYGITNGECTGNNQVLLGNTAITEIRAQVTGITAYSDQRFKTNIADDVKGLDFILKLRPVSYNENPEILHHIWGTPDSLWKKIDYSQIQNTRFIGLLAQEVHQAMKESGYTHFTGIDVPKNEKEVYSLRYVDFIMPMIKAIQEQQKLIENQKQEIAKMKAEIEAIKNELMQQKVNVGK
ncbi:tail fiber domain-containing protein, partial [Raineya sp.]